MYAIYRTDSQNLNIRGYHKLISNILEDTSSNRGDLVFYSKDKHSIRNDLSVFIPHISELLFIEFKTKYNLNKIVGVIYRPKTAPEADLNIFSKTDLEMSEKRNRGKTKCSYWRLQYRLAPF